MVTPFHIENPKAKIGALAVLVMCFGTIACGHTSRVTTQPPGAEIYLNGRFVGESPVELSASRGLPRRYRVQVFHRGFEPIDLYVDTEMSYVLGAMGTVTLLPYLWAWSLPANLDFNLVGSPGRAAELQRQLGRRLWSEKCRRNPEADASWTHPRHLGGGCTEPRSVPTPEGSEHPDSHPTREPGVPTENEERWDRFEERLDG